MVELDYSLVAFLLIVIAFAMVEPILLDMYLAYRRKQTARSAGSESTGNLARCQDSQNSYDFWNNTYSWCCCHS